MTNNIFYRQCRLKKGKSLQVAWIPEKFAKVGKYIKIRDDDGWLVEEVGDARIVHSEVIERSQDYKHQRKASDI